jgi:peptidoglycan/LPS O-acetylase OafA/YrhL
VARTGEVVQAGETRSARIESLRAVAALAVLVFHVLVFTAFDGPLARFAFAGHLGVFLFFALTGYLLYMPFARAAYAGGRRVDLGRYARNRVLRILPLYYAALAILLIVGHSGGSGEQWLKFGTLTQSFFADTVRNHVDGPMWSLAVELQFYALLPLLAWALVRARTRQAAAVAVAVLGLVSVVVWERKVYGMGIGADRWRYSLPATFFEFTPGMLLALLQLEIESRRSVRLPSSTVLIGAAIACWVAAAYWVKGGALVAALASFLLLAAIVLPAEDGPLARVLDLRALSIVGVASYSLYLWHFPVLEAIQKRADLGFAGLLALGLLVCVSIALVSYVAIERPFLGLRRRWGATVAGGRR